MLTSEEAPAEKRSPRPRTKLVALIKFEGEKDWAVFGSWKEFHDWRESAPKVEVVQLIRGYEREIEVGRKTNG